MSLVRSRPHAVMMARASLTTPAGAISAHPQPLPEAPDGECGAEGNEAGSETGNSVGDAREDELPDAVKAAVEVIVAGVCVAHRCSFQLVRTMTMEPAGAVA